MKPLCGNELLNDWLVLRGNVRPIVMLAPIQNNDDAGVATAAVAALPAADGGLSQNEQVLVLADKRRILSEGEKKKPPQVSRTETVTELYVQVVTEIENGANSFVHQWGDGLAFLTSYAK